MTRSNNDSQQRPVFSSPCRALRGGMGGLSSGSVARLHRGDRPAGRHLTARGATVEAVVTATAWPTPARTNASNTGRNPAPTDLLPAPSTSKHSGSPASHLTANRGGRAASLGAIKVYLVKVGLFFTRNTTAIPHVAVVTRAGPTLQLFVAQNEVMEGWEMVTVGASHCKVPKRRQAGGAGGGGGMADRLLLPEVKNPCESNNSLI